MRSSESKLKNGDCSSCTSRPWRRVPSKTESPVVLVKSARTTVSFSDSFEPECDTKYQAPAATSATAAPAITYRFRRELVDSASGEAEAALPRPLELLFVPDEDG